MIALGVLLLLSPLYVDLLALGEPTYRYERVQVAYVDGEVEYTSPGEDPFFPMLEVADVACLPGSSRTCQFEQFLLSDENATVPTDNTGASLRAFTDYEYVYVERNDEGQFYRPDTAGDDESTWRLTLEPVPAERALAEAATFYADASRPVRRGVLTGNVTTHHELAGANELVEEDGDYYFLHMVGASPPRGGERLFKFALVAGGVAAGLLLVLRGQRRRMT